MTFDLHKVLKYLYENNNSNLENISPIIKQNLINDREDVSVTFDMLIDEDIIMVVPASKESEGHYYQLGLNNKDGIKNTLDNFPLMVKMTTPGREFYQRTYLEFDRDRIQNRLIDSIISTNRFIKYTFGAVLLSAGIQIYYIYISKDESIKNREQLERFHKQEQSMPPPMVKIYLHDSLQKLDSVK
jgi:hypothetical protein